ncbi:hypothetical protein [Chryseobacterium sp.]|uniref:hypothetical protein n=1 Tax=Chryseobacterium sp. TaxID=1871047 RepID=UPI0035C7545A
MKSIAIWETRTDGNPPQPIELHFNYWKIPRKNKDLYRFLDIGIKVPSTLNTKSINLFFPARVENDNFQEIVTKFISKPDLVSAIFNENFTVVAGNNSKKYKILNDENQELFTIYECSENDINYEYRYGGTIVTLNLPNLDQTIYTRFRISGDFLHQLSTISTPSNSILESAFSELEMVDFRVNEIRDLNKDLIENYGKMSLISKQHFFYICSDKEEVVGYHTPFLSCRNLENYRWNGYVDLPNTENEIFLAYHWKFSNLSDTSLLIKSRYEKNNYKTIAKYIFVIIIISIGGSMLYDLLKWLVKLLFK